MAEVLSRAADLDDEDLQQEYISLCSFDSVDAGIRISGHAVIAVMRCAILCACCTASVKGACMTHSTLNTHEKSWQHDGKTKYITGYCDTNVHDTVPLPLMLLVMMNAQMVIDAAHDDDDVDARAVAAGVHDGGERENHLPLINPEEGLRGFGERQQERNCADYALQRWRGRRAHRLRWKRRGRRGAVHCAAGPCAGEGH